MDYGKVFQIMGGFLQVIAAALLWCKALQTAKQIREHASSFATYNGITPYLQFLKQTIESQSTDQARALAVLAFGFVLSAIGTWLS